MAHVSRVAVAPHIRRPAHSRHAPQHYHPLGASAHRTSQLHRRIAGPLSTAVTGLQCPLHAHVPTRRGNSTQRAVMRQATGFFVLPVRVLAVGRHVVTRGRHGPPPAENLVWRPPWCSLWLAAAGCEGSRCAGTALLAQPSARRNASRKPLATPHRRTHAGTLTGYGVQGGARRGRWLSPVQR